MNLVVGIVAFLSADAAHFFFGSGIVSSSNAFL